MKLLEHTVVVPTELTPVHGFPFACVHKDNEGHCAEKWLDWRQEVRRTPNSFTFGLGDYHDWLRTHAREFLRHYPHDRNSFDYLHKFRRDEAAKFADDLEPIANKLAFLSLGNHHHEFGDGTNDVQEICRLLSVPYGGHGGYLRLYIKTQNRPAHITLNILYHHGEKIGGGASNGGDINAMMKKAQNWDFDCLALAHNHKKHGHTETILTIPKRGEMQLVEKPQCFIRAGCFVRGYVKDCVTYAEAAGLMNPTAIGYVRWDILPKKDKRGILRYDFKTYF